MIPKIKYYHQYNKQTRSAYANYLQQADYIRGCVPYWTISSSFFKGRLLEQLSKEKSFFCVHLDAPTKIDVLTEFHKRKANLYCYNLISKTKFADGNFHPLLHAKVTLFNMPNEKAVIWIGSHNFTQSALLDVNIEMTIAIETDIHSDDYREVETFLERTKDNCAEYDVKLAKWHQILRRNGVNNLTAEDIAELYGLDSSIIDEFHKTQTLFLVGNNIGELDDDTKNVIQIIGLDSLFNKALSVKRKRIYLYVQDVESECFYVYPAIVLLTGDIFQGISASSDMSFSTRPFAIIKKDLKGAFLKSAREIKKEDLEKAAYVTSLFVEKKISKFKIFPNPSTTWETVSNPDNVKGLDTTQRQELLADDKEASKKLIKSKNDTGSSSEKSSINFKKISIDLDKLTSDETQGIEQVMSKDFRVLEEYYRTQLLRMKEVNVLFDEVKSRPRFDKIPDIESIKFTQSHISKMVVIEK